MSEACHHFRVTANVGHPAVQGLGGGAITALVQIILADLVPLLERGTFNGIMALCVDVLVSLFISHEAHIGLGQWVEGQAQ